MYRNNSFTVGNTRLLVSEYHSFCEIWRKIEQIRIKSKQPVHIGIFWILNIIKGRKFYNIFWYTLYSTAEYAQGKWFDRNSPSPHNYDVGSLRLVQQHYCESSLLLQLMG